jgi:hypothetical protein
MSRLGRIGRHHQIAHDGQRHRGSRQAGQRQEPADGAIVVGQGITLLSGRRFIGVMVASNIVMIGVAMHAMTMLVIAVSKTGVTRTVIGTLAGRMLMKQPTAQSGHHIDSHQQRASQFGLSQAKHGRVRSARPAKTDDLM